MPSEASVVSYSADICHLFRDFDVEEMKRERQFDLHNYDDVVARADRILRRLRRGDMPCDAPWPAERVDLFAKWIADGTQP